MTLSLSLLASLFIRFFSNFKLNEEMENLILDFINNTFKDDQTINLEKVGQYLKADNLKILVNEDNDWQNFVKQKLSSKG
jgi:hypothetical protein